MNNRQKPNPGISREARISDDGLKRLERQLAAGSKLTDAVLQQWVRRYGKDAEELIEKFKGKEK